VRAYELMVIHDGTLDDVKVQEHIKELRTRIEEAGTLHKFDFWGRRKFAYEINHKNEGYYSVFEIVAEGGALDEAERTLRLADAVVRHKLFRLPDAEAKRRGMLGGVAAAPAV
jgi:small subunit ribosomal protein S6